MPSVSDETTTREIRARRSVRLGAVFAALLIVASGVSPVASATAATPAGNEASLRTHVTAVTGSGPNPTNEQPQKASDGDSATKWLVQTGASAEAPVHLQYDLDAPAPLVSYTLTAANDAPERDPKDIEVLGSDDGETWASIDVQTGLVLGARGAKTTHVLSSPSPAYGHYRLSITANGGADGVQLAEWELFTPAQPPAPGSTLTSFVNPFIGSQDDGNTYPGATVPFGMVQFSPDNGHNTGYNYDRDRIRGFSLVHLSGVGCGLGGLLPVLPTTGIPTETNYERYALPYAHDSEEASPGYYAVDLAAPAGAVRAELTATEHTGIQRYTFPQTDTATVMLNPGHALNSVTGSSITILDARTVETTITSRGFCQDTQPFTVHTRTTFDRDIAAYGTWKDSTITAGSDHAEGAFTGAYVTFDATTDRDVEAVTSLSYVDADGARANADAESTTFDAARTAADATWEERLQLVKVPTTDTNHARVFYSSLYRSFLAPNTGTDVDGRYFGWDGETHDTGGEFTYYQNYSLWDTYRTQQQLLYLLAPSESRDMAISLVAQGEQYGWLPRWGYGPVETNVMTGDPGTAFLVSAWNQGLLAGYEERAYAVLKNNADNVPPAESSANGRAGNPVYLSEGYVPFQPDENNRPGDYDLHHGASATLEYALSDGLLSTMATALGHDDDAARYAERAENYKAIFDPTTGNFRPRDRSGFFVEDPDPAQTRGFHEGTALQYQWLATQDVPGLIDLLGGTSATQQRLDDFFAYDRAVADPAGTARDLWVNGTYSYYGQRTYNPNNEPDLHAPYLYQWVGQPWKTTDVVRAALTLFTDAPNGVTGNDDLGTMSAWYVLSAMGIYPIMPGTDVWGLSTPAFDSIDVTLDAATFGTDALHLRAPGLTDANRYIQQVSTGDTANLARSYLTGDDLIDAGTVTFALGQTPSSWATGTDAAPAGLVTSSEVTSTLNARVTPAYAGATAGGTTTVSLEVIARAAGAQHGTITVTGSDVVSSDTASLEWTITSDGVPVSQRVPLTLRVAPGTTAGTYPVMVHVTSDTATPVDVAANVVIGDSAWLVASFDNTGIGDARQGNADFDGGGFYLLRDQLAAQGYTQGAGGVVAGTALTFAAPAVEAGHADNLRANGQTLTIPDTYRHARGLSLIGAANNGNSGGDLVMTFTDGSTSSTPVVLSDWCTGDPASGNVVVAKAGQRGSGKSDPQNIGCGLYSTARVDVPEGKTLQSVTLPQAPQMHVFTVAFDVPAPIAPALTMELTPASPTVGDTVTITVHTTPAEAAGELVLTRVEGTGSERTQALRARAETETEIARVPVQDGSGTFQVTAAADEERYRVAFVPTDAGLFAPSALGTDIVITGADPSPGEGGGTGGGSSGDGASGGANSPDATDAASSSSLARTGGQLAIGLIPLAALAILTGAAVLLRRRARSSE